MNIILVTRFYPPDTGGGGIAAYAHFMARGLLERGHQVRIISRLGQGSKPHQVCAGIPVYRIPAPMTSYRWTRVPGLGPQVRLIRDLAYAWRVRRLLVRFSQDWKPDVVEYADIDAEGFCHPSICPSVVKLHTPHRVLQNYYTAQETPYAVGGIELLEEHTIRHAEGISSPSHYLASLVADMCRIKASRIQWVPNSIDTDFFSPDTPEDSQLSESVLYVGRLETRKGAWVFTQAISLIARAMPTAKFIFLGADRSSSTGGSQKEKLEAYLTKEGLRDRVQFDGHGSPEVFREFYRRATVFVMPSLFENCPYTLLEAMACGKPVVVSRAGGMTEMIKDRETGLFFEAGDSVALAEATISLLQSSSRRRELGCAARDLVLRRYTLAVGAEATERFYRCVIAGWAITERS